MSGRTATQPRRQARPSRSAAGKSKQLSDDDEEDIAVEDDEEEEIDDEEEMELLPPDPDHVAVRFTVGDTFEEDSIVTVTPEDSDSVPLAVTFQTKVLQCNTERSVVKLQYQVIDRQLYDAYANTVLRPGATLLSNDGTKCAKVVELDAEWHRGQPWAKNSEHLGKSVRWHVQGLGMRDGVVWGWLPSEESDFTDDSGQAAPLWRIRFDPSQEATAAPADLEEFELQKALEMFRAKDARGAVGKDSGRKRSREAVAEEPAQAAGDRTLGAAGAASARSDKASSGSGTRQDVMASKEPEREREGERQRDREGDKEADKEREKLRLREKASETEAWVASVVDAMGKNSASTVAAKVLPRLALLKDLKVAQDKSKAADTIQGLNDIAQRSPGVFTIKSVVDECLLLLAWSAGPSPKDGIIQHQLAASVLLAGHKDQDVWPAALVKAYLDDAMQMRRWVDIPQAAVLVANVVTAFPGVRPSQTRGGGPGAEKDRDSKSVLSGKEPEHKRRKMGGAGLERGGHGAESSGGQRDVGKDLGNAEGEEVRARFRDSALQREVQSIVLESVKRHLNTQPAGDSLQSQRKMHNVLRALAYLMGYEAVRHETMKRLDSWLSNPNLVRHLKELMPRLASQCTLSTDLESDTLRMMLRIRPKPNVTQVYNEALGTLCRCNRGFPLRAFFVLLEIEMKDYDSFLHASNKALKNSQYIGTILKSAGVPHLIADRPPELGGSFQRFNVMDMGLGKLDYEIQGSLRRWSTVMLDSTEGRGGAMVSASGVILVALEEEVFAGDNCGNSQHAKLRSAALRAQDAGAAGLVVVLTSNGQWAASPRSWDESSVSIPVLGTMPGDDSLSLLEAISGKFSVAGKAGSVTTGALSRVPREILLAKSIQVFADSPDKRAGMALLLRKVLKTCQIGGVPELDLVAFAVATMTPGDNFDVLDRDSKVLWACALVDVCVYVCIHLASQVIDAGQASVHADRGGGGLETRSQRAAVRVRAQVMRIVDEILVSWVPAVLRPHVPVDKLNHSLRRMLFYEDAATYSVEPLVLETHEKQAVKLLQAEMGMTQASLLALARLGQRDSAGFRAIEPMMALELVEVLVRRALPVAARRHSEVLPSDAAPNSAKAIGRDAEVLRISETHVCLWEVLVELARSCGSGDDGGHPDLAPATRVWQAYLNITVLAVLNPETLGLLVWTRLPTIRSMMQMLITGNFTFPPLETDSEALAADADAAKQDMAAAEEQQAKRALKRLHVPKWLETATLLLPSGPARRPPKETLAMLRMLDTQCDLGQLLRQSSEPNMLLETISAPGQDSSSCVGWLGAVLKRYPATASALPVVTVCELLLANLGAAPTSFIAPPMVRVHRKEQSTMYGLATRLAQCIHSKNEWDGMLFFLQMIGHHNEQKRRLAVVALELLLVCLDDLRKTESEKEVPRADNAHGGAEDEMGGNDQGAGSGEEEELLAGGGDSTGVEEEELLSGGGNADGEPQEEGAKMGAEGDFGENTLDKIAEGNGRVLWLQRLISMENVPANVRETLGLQLRGALKTETQVQLLLEYLQYLSQDKSSSVTGVARDVAYLVVRRRVLVQHLSKLPGAITVLSRIFLAGLSSRESDTTTGDSSMNSADGNGDDDELVNVPGSTHSTARIVLRAGLQTLGLSGVEAHATAEDVHGERAKLVQLVAPSKEAVAILGLTDDEITLMLQADDAHVMACAVAAASLPQLIAALRLCGAAPVCLAAVVTRLKGMDDVVSPLAAALPSRMGARAVSALALKYPEEAAWLSGKLGLKLGAPKKLVPPDLSKMLPPAMTESCQMEIDVAAAVKRDAAAAVSADCPPRSSCSDGPLMQVSAAVGLSALVAAEAPRGGWKAVVRGLMERGVPTNEKGLQMDLMATVNPLMWKDADAKVYERVFALRPATGADNGHGNGGVGRSDSGRVTSSCAALLGPMLRLGGVAGGMCLENCRQWLLSSVLIDCETGDMRVKTATHGDLLQDMGTVLDCSLCLEVLSACITGESGPVEGVWGEGGGGEVSETKTRRENLGLGSRVFGETGGGGGDNGGVRDIGALHCIGRLQVWGTNGYGSHAHDGGVAQRRPAKSSGCEPRVALSCSLAVWK